MHTSDASAVAPTDSGSAVAPGQLRWMVAFFALSGLTGLIYQSIWTQYLGLILGSAAYAQSLVLAIFMGGMALGSWLASRWAGRIANLLLGYGLIEGAIGVFALLFHTLFVLSSRWLYDDWIPALSSPLAIDLVRWGLAAALILPQTVLLGMTFPIMSTGLMRWLPQQQGAILGGLYFLNSAGAAVGALLATFALVPAVGLAGALAFAGLINLLILAGVVFARFPRRVVDASDGATTRTPPAASSQLQRVLLLAAALTGLSSFMYEIGWVRMLSLALGSSLHAFELMLAAFIGGLAAGAWYARRWLDRSSQPLRLVAWAQLAMGGAALLTLPLYDHAFVWVSWLIKTLAPSESGYVFYNAASALISIAIMAPAAFFAGTTLPAMTYVLLREGRGERVVGLVYAANTVGAIVGVMFMVHWALPVLGLKFSMMTAACIDLGIGLGLLLWQREARPRAVWAALAMASAAVAMATLFADFDPRRLNSGVYRSANYQLEPQRKIWFAADGKTASVALHGIPGKFATIATNGKPDAAMALDLAADASVHSADEPTMILVSLLGLAFKPDAADIANIGFGSGLSTHTFASSSIPRRITTVEIEPTMVEAARGFGTRVERAYSDPRSRIVIDDARAYFSAQHARYDLIVSEPSNPWVSGVARLFSQEFYAFVGRHLNKDGLFLQWVQAYEISDATVMSLMRAIDGSFDDYALYLTNDTDILIVAKPHGQLPQPSARFLDDAPVRELAQIAGVQSLQDVIERKLADRSVLHAVLAEDGGPANSDYRPVLAHWAPRDRYMRQRANTVLGLYDSPWGALTFAGRYSRNQPQAWRAPPINHPVVSSRRWAERLADGALALGRAGESDADLLWHGMGTRLREAGQACFAGMPPKAASRLLLRSFQATAPYLDRERLAQLWRERAWLACRLEQLPAPVPGLLQVMQATVDLDGAAMAQGLGTLASDQRERIDADMRVYLVGAEVLAAYLLGDTAAADRALNTAAADSAIPARSLFGLRATRRVLDSLVGTSADSFARVNSK